MTRLTETEPWLALTQARDRLRAARVTDLFDAEEARHSRLSLRLTDDFVFDFSKQRITAEVFELLVTLAEARGVQEGMRRMAEGERINATEGRAALHIALRGDGYRVDGRDASGEVRATRARMFEVADAFRAGALKGARGATIRRIVNLGIGGSDLGPRMATKALAAYGSPNLRVDYVANVDPSELSSVLEGANADETAFIVSSKSFTTIETLTNAKRARCWLGEALGGDAAIGAHFFAVSNNVAAAQAFGIAKERCLELPEWVGGRYSLWSAIGLPLACAIGRDHFDALLGGAAEMDRHFLSAPLAANLPVVMALLGVWNTDFLGAESLAVLPYSHALGDLPAYLQQLEMESNGKRVTRAGMPADYATAPIVWGSSGTVGQHAFHQLFYQGTRLTPIDFVVPVEPGDDEESEARRILVANAMAQAAALMRGKSEDEAHHELVERGVSRDEASRLAPHLACPGNQPSSTLLFRGLSPRNLGRLIALYEHKVFVQGWIWGINSFDQYGVELGKQMARALENDSGRALDASTAALIALIEEWRAKDAGNSRGNA